MFRVGRNALRLQHSYGIARQFASHVKAPLFRFGDEGTIEQSQDLLKQITGSWGADAALRDSCKCPRCIDQSTKQREFSFADIPLDIRANPQKDSNGNWKVRWTNDVPGYDDHVSTFTPYEIKSFRPIPTNKNHVPTMIWDVATFNSASSSIKYDFFMNDEDGLAAVLNLFGQYGLVFIKEVPNDQNSVSRIAQRIARLRNTFYGDTWDVRSVPEAKNVAYTSKYLGFHMDLLYMKEPPTVQFLHCLENSCTGGESRFVDSFKAYDVLETENPELAKILRRSHIRYEYDNDGQYYSDIKPIVQMRQTAEVPQRVVKGASMKSVLQTISRIYWSPPFVGSVRAEPGENADKIHEKIEASKAFAEILERPELVIEERMEPGTCAMFDNLRVLHARNAFDMNSGKRWLRGCYLDGQDAVSKEYSLRNKIRSIAKTNI